MSVTTLPSLHVGGKVTQQVIKHIPQPPTTKSPVSKAGKYNKRIQNQRTLSSKGSGFSYDADKKDVSTQGTFIDTARYRNSYKHNLCLDMLQEGFHQAFCELFNLLEKEKQFISHDRVSANEMTLKLSEDDPEKLEKLKENLIAAEIASRRGRIDQVYQSHLNLAEYFSNKGDSWLSNYFYCKCLVTSLQVRGDGRRKEAEANYNLGLSAEKESDLDQAVSYMEVFYDLTKDKDWEDDSGDKLHKNSCVSLKRMYTAIAEQIDEGDPDQAIEYLKKAFEMAQEGGNEQQIGKAGFRLGRAFEENGDSEEAIKYFTDYLDICNSTRDDVGKGQAYQALASAHHMQGDVSNAIQYLTMFLDIAERSGQKEARGVACSGLGSLYNSLGQYEQASEYFRQSFQSSKEVNKPELTEATRTEYGIGSAHELFDRFTKFIVLNSKDSNSRVMTWKDARSEMRNAEDSEGPGKTSSLNKYE